ncbi:hypothetical protein MIMGU_mgv1a020812mg, partial [Erythranthe guttata]
LRDHLECNVSLYAQKPEPHSSGAENLNPGTSGKRCKWMWKCLGMDKDETETEDKPPEQVEEVDRTERRRPGKERVMVCNKWPMLLSFVCCGWHRRDRPLIIRYYCSGHLRISIIDGNSEKDCYTKALEPLKYAYVVGSCNGLLLISRRGTASESCMNLLFNPLSKKCFTTDSGPSETAACGFFFHPLDKECRILSVRKLNDQHEYHVYLFGENRWRKTLKPHFSCQPYTSEERFTSETRIDCNPAIVKHALHWYIGQIMVFDMVTEEFSTKSNPISEEQYKGGCRVQRLLVKDDQLCLCYVGHDDSAMDIWICEDYDTWSWVKKYVVSLDWDMGKYPTQKEFTIKDIFKDVRVLSIRENEMILFWISRGMFSYNLDKSTVKKIHLQHLSNSRWVKDQLEGVTQIIMTSLQMSRVAFESLGT